MEHMSEFNTKLNKACQKKEALLMKAKCAMHCVQCLQEHFNNE